MAKRRRSHQEFAELRKTVAARLDPDVRVFTRRDLQSWGIDGAAVVPMIGLGLWTRLHHGIYVETSTLAYASERQRHLILCQAAQRSLPAAAPAFGPTAALTHGLPVDRAIVGDVHLTRSRTHDQRAFRRRVSRENLLPSVHMHSYPPLGAVVVEGVLTVSRAMAAVSCAAMSDREWAVATMDAAIWLDSAGSADLAEAAGVMPGARGMGVVRGALPLVRWGAQSPLESLSRVRLCDRGMEEPELQAAVHDRDGLIGYVDMLWRRQQVIGEADGQMKYLTRADLLAEKAREDRLRDQGFRVVRWTWDDIMRRPDDVADRIRRAMRHRQRTGTNPSHGIRETA